MREERTENLHFRVTRAEKEQIKRYAKRAGMSMSDYARRQALQKQVKIVTPEFISDYKQICGELGRFGNNINQIAKYLNSTGDTELASMWLKHYQAELTDCLMRMKMAVDKMAA